MKKSIVKRMLTAAAITAMMVSSVAGCGSSSAPQGGSTGAPASTESTGSAGGESTGAAGGAADQVVVGPSGGATTGDVVAEGLADKTSSKDTMVIRMDSDPGTLDGLTTSIMNATQILSIANCTLLRTSYDENYGTVYKADERYAIAKGYEVADDNTSVTFEIRDDAKWHDGNPVTAEDILYSINRYSANSRYAYIDYAATSIVDPTHIKVVLAETNANAVTDIGAMCLVEKAVHESIGNEQYFTTPDYVGCGAYKITDWVAGDSLSLEAVDDYFGGAPKIKNIRIRFIAEASVAMMELETGGVDVIDIPNWNDVANVLDGQYNGVAKHIQIPDMLHTMVGYNLSADSPCADLKVRQAIAYAIDRDVVALGAYEGVGEVAYTFFSSNTENQRVFSEEEWPYHLDIEKSKELLKEAGYENGFEMTILTNQDANRSLAAQIIKSQLAEVGITANIVNYDNATYAATMSGETDSWDIWLRNWTTGTCWYQYFTMVVETNCHPQVDETWTKYYDIAMAMGKEMDQDARYAMEDEITATIMDDGLYTYNLISPVKHVIVGANLMDMERMSYNWNVLDAYFE